MKSMTGFGQGHGHLENVRIQCEIRSVNQKGIDVKVRLPRDLSDFEIHVSEAVKKKCTRGRFDVTVRMELNEEQGHVVTLNQQRLAAIMEGYRACQAAWPELDTRVSLGDILQIPGILNEETAQSDPDNIRQALLSVVDSALDGLWESRVQEGASLGGVLHNQVQACRAYLEEITKMVQKDPDHIKTRLKEKLASIDSSVSLSEDRLAQEVLYLVEKSDVTEEIDRLHIHLNAFLTLFEAQDPVGRQLDFLCQEIFREINTLGNKIGNAEASLKVIDFKSELQRIREQVQNIE